MLNGMHASRTLQKKTRPSIFVEMTCLREMGLMNDRMPVSSRVHKNRRSGKARRIGLLVVASAVVIGALGLVSGTSGAAQRHSSKKSTGVPGTLIESVPVSAPGVNGTAYLVKYWSESFPKNKPVTVTGLVFVPPGTPPAGGWPVVSWAHATNGLNGSCAPSGNPEIAVPEINVLLAQGWEVTATDYQGEGNKSLKPTKGILPYLVGASAARNTIDIVRAAQQSATFHASPNYVVWGHSEGGQTAMFVLEIASSYAPSLNLKGVMALAPPSNLNTLIPLVVESGPNAGYLFLLVAGFNAAYGNARAPLLEMLTAIGKREVTLLKRECLAGFGDPYNTVFAHPAGSALPAKWQALVNQNDPGNFTAASSAPLVIVSGDQDDLVWPVTTNSLANELCALSPPQDLERWLYAGLGHDVEPSAVTINDYVQWTANRFAGDVSHDYTPTGGDGHTVTVTQSCG
ncbi:MAG: lipase family protein [Acidimicrobiales bacterium]|nr:lipase family protein [Acidimicrobiales bacterium]